jgi:transcription initiation factor TFIIIB Brf1 subunit/transcription initiation factor TFIIB
MPSNERSAEETTNSSTTSKTVPDECPTCGGKSYENLTGVPQPLCSDCGLVIGTTAEIPQSLEETEDEGRPGTESWTEYYSVTNSTEQQVATAIDHVETIGDQLFLSADTRIQAAEVYADAARDTLTDGRPTVLTVAAAICIGSREATSPRPSERVAQAADIEVQRVKQMIRTFQEELDRGYIDLSPAAYVPYLCEDADLNDTTTQQASNLINGAKMEDLTPGGHPVGVAAAAVYLVAEEEVSQRGIAAVAGVTKETIRVRLNELREMSGK